MENPVVFAVAAHPDDVEFMMAGTLLRLRDAGCELHVMNVGSGNCGSQTMDGPTAAATRLEEARDAARVLGATLHPPLAHDLEITYSGNLLRRLAAVMREVNPSIVLAQCPLDYMEDHMITARLAVTAAFSRGMPNFITDPPTAPVAGAAAVYHALPYGLCDGLRNRVRPHCYVDISPVLDRKREALACHRSQREWLDASQGLDSYVTAMVDMAREVGQWSGRFQHAEGWIRHSHLGFCGPEDHPLRDLLGEAVMEAEGLL